MDSARKTQLMLDLPFHTRVREGHSYLESSLASLGVHELEACLLDSGGRNTLRVLLDGSSIYKSGDIMPAVEWFDLCREGGYRPRFDWDRDPVAILFQGVLPAMAQGWKDFPLPYEEDGFPEGVDSLVSLQKVHIAFTSHFSEISTRGASAQVAKMFARLPLRAVVLHDRPGQRADYLGNALDESYIGIDLILGSRADYPVRLGKVRLSSLETKQWSSWMTGGRWGNDGREFIAKENVADFLRASGLLVEPLAGFEAAFDALIQDYATFMNEVVERYLTVYPATPTRQHRVNQYLHFPVETRPSMRVQTWC